MLTFLHIEIVALIKQLDVDLQTVDSKIKMLDEAVDSGDSTKIMTALSLAVPTYTPDFK